jgi:UDP-GlcNAc:undecaprenyl-phosphate GlcNAc-1-phosphate transferase
MNATLAPLIVQSALPALIAFTATILAIVAARPLAIRVGLVDHPGGRKRHAMATPLVGGLAMLAGSAPLALATFELTPNIIGLISAGFVVVAAGLLDDLFDLRWYWRFIAQGAAALLMIGVGGVQIEQLGPLVDNRFELGFLSIPFTVLVVIGLMNALNMVDGLDGLAGGVTAAALVMLIAATAYSGNARLAHGLIILFGALAAFLVFNLRSPWRSRASIFLGNAGSEFLGLVIAWCCIRLTQNPEHPVTPALAPYLLALPVIDCVTVMARRIRTGRSPFAAARDHMHHLLRDAGWSTGAAVILIVGVSFVIGFCGALAVKAGVRPIWLIAAFAGLTLAYYLLTARRERAIWALQGLRGVFGLPAIAPAPDPLDPERNSA